MPTGIIGQPYVFQILFANEQNLPVAATDATISVYKFDIYGARITLVGPVSMSPVVGDVGRFTYVLLDTSMLDPGDIIYGFMTGVNPDTGARFLHETDVSMGGATASTGALTARFVKGG